MKMKTVGVVAALVMVAVFAAGVQAAFIVEGGVGGLAQATNFTGFGRPSIAGGATGLTVPSIWTGSGAASAGGTPDFLFSYTPGTDDDNAPLAAGTPLGNGVLASGLDGGGTGLYNVYATWPVSTNVNAAGATITVTRDGGLIEGVYNQNTDQSGIPGGNDAWLLIASNVYLTQGTQYTVNMHANAWTWTSMRANGVMWEAVPEPATMLLLGAGALLLRRRR